MKLEDIALEYRGASLGDMRRNKRLERIGLELARNPDLSFPEAMGSEGQLEGLYRFLNNDDVTFEAVHAPHAEQTRLRCQAQHRVLVLHDTTILKFNGDREGLGRIYEEGGTRGFRLHASLAVTPARTPLGVLRAETWARTTPPRRDMNRRHMRADPERESLRWGRAVRACEEQLGPAVGAVHVMDRAPRYVTSRGPDWPIAQSRTARPLASQACRRRRSQRTFPIRRPSPSSTRGSTGCEPSEAMLR